MSAADLRRERRSHGTNLSSSTPRPEQRRTPSGRRLPLREWSPLGALSRFTPDARSDLTRSMLAQYQPVAERSPLVVAGHCGPLCLCRSLVLQPTWLHGTSGTTPPTTVRQKCPVHVRAPRAYSCVDSRPDQPSDHQRRRDLPLRRRLRRAASGAFTRRLSEAFSGGISAWTGRSTPPLSPLLLPPQV